MPASKQLATFLLFTLFFNLNAQSESDYTAFLVSPELSQKANAVVRYERLLVEVKAYNKMLVTTKRVVTVLNEYGNKHLNAFEFYDSNTKIKELEAKIYDASGKEIKKVKERDFTDMSAVSGGTLYSDNRVKFLDYTPVKYPYTLEFNSEVEFRSTAFIPQWHPIDDYHLAVEDSEYQLINDSGITINKKALNFESYNIERLGDFHVKAVNLSGIKPEVYSPSLSEITPSLKLALTKFDMEGVEGVNNNWKDFGAWMYNNLLTGTDDLPQSAIDDVKALTAGVEDKMERAKMVYKYMQDKTRYISVQVGIGGWKPILANEVDKLGYGDCKGLTNYTKALLEAVDVPSYYTVIYGDRDIRDMDSEFSVTEGNHVILSVPTNEDIVFLECTSQTAPFGFTAGFTDDRDALMVTPEGGKIVHTKRYSSEESLQDSKARIVLDDSGALTAELEIKSQGFQYALREGIQNQSPRDQKVYYKNYFDNLNNLEIDEMVLHDDKDIIVFKETLKVNASNYASKSGNRLIFQPNIFNALTSIPSRYNKRQLDFKIERGYTDVDEYLIELPNDMEIEAMSKGESINTKFGSYEFRTEVLEGNILKYTRKYLIKKGDYKKSDYNEFRDFRKEVLKHDKAKIVLVKKNN